MPASTVVYAHKHTLVRMGQKQRETQKLVYHTPRENPSFDSINLSSFFPHSLPFLAHYLLSCLFCGANLLPFYALFSCSTVFVHRYIQVNRQSGILTHKYTRIRQHFSRTKLFNKCSTVCCYQCVKTNVSVQETNNSQKKFCCCCFIVPNKNRL